MTPIVASTVQAMAGIFHPFVSLCFHCIFVPGHIASRLKIILLFLGNTCSNIINNNNMDEYIWIPRQRFHRADVVIIGATSCYGYQLLHMLKKENISVALVEDIDSLGASSTVGYSWAEVDYLGFQPKWINMSQPTTMILSQIKPHTIVYTPFNTLFSDPSTTIKYSDKLSSTLKKFVMLLEVIRTNHLDITIVLPLVQSHTHIHQPWLKQFKATLQVYKSLYHVKVSVIDVHDVADGAGKQKCHLGDLTGSNSNKACHSETIVTTCRPVAPPTKDILISSYFTSASDPQRKAKVSENSRYMVHWFVGAMKLNLNIVIFYDELDQEWMNRIKRLYTKATFVKVDLKGRSVYDARFYIIHDYLANHPEINRAFLTDLSDIQILQSPFELMNRIDNQLLYMGIDESFYLTSYSNEWMVNLYTRCYTPDTLKAEEEFLDKLITLYNAGMIGGTREVLLAMLHRTLQWLDIAKKDTYCDMGAVNIAAHKYFYDELFFGYPLQSGYKITANAPGLFLKHK